MQDQELKIESHILNLVKEFQNFTLYVHERPDFDALGSAYAFKEFLKEYFPDKKAYVMGTYKLDSSFGANVFPFEKEEVDNEFLKSSLAIVFDTANSDRVLTGKHVEAKKIIRFDHHPKIEDIGDIDWVDPTFSSTAEMVGTFLKLLNYKLTPIMAKYIYSGILTDTGRFLYLSSSPNTFRITADLLQTGFNRSEIHDIVYNKSISEHKYYFYTLNHAKVTPNGLAYVLLPKNSHKRFGISYPMTMVHALNNIKNVYIWIALYYDNESGKWKGSIRSRDIPINHFASMFNGGGHKFASGFSLDNKKDFKKIINLLDSYLKSLKNSK
ncbi:DHH family phosphoesterase [Mycoplasmoides pirum]|uniref:DHH family phosphoesterase n=1 Tax=Mycoplasmoides pirum TaxID=2122 RepID=UPI00055AE8A2|nr:bifunctional oligoribonuclease/PAP phosphatase NrnA [Mycoplasmoides pirum]